jgi:hypothetical protein
MTAPFTEPPFASQSILFVSRNQRADIEQYFSARSIVIQNNPDVLIVESEKALGIDDVRTVQMWSMNKPYAHLWKVAVLLGAESLSIPAQNAMLKLLEEPPKNTFLILIATSPYRLLPTMRSRCQLLHFDSAQSTEFDTDLPATLSDAYQKIDQVAKSRDEAITYCEALLQQKHQQLESTPSVQLLLIVRRLSHAIDLMKSNVNTRLLLEQLLTTTIGEYST